MAKTVKRPVFLNLLQIRMPVMAMVSIGHRISGVLLFLLLPLILWLLGSSLRDPAGYAMASEWITGWPGGAVVVVAFWWFGHHLLAGIRHLLADGEVGTELYAARQSAWAVIAGGVLSLLAATVVALL